jgi:NAD(P)-dependent dehydrogenase (short-subunit alcohol dehydrogenase family)
MNVSFDFRGRQVLVTGGVSGIGRAISLAFKHAGAQVIACGLTEEEMLAARAETAFESIRIEPLDVGDRGAVDGLVGSLDRLDAVVHCAGIIRRDAEFDPEVFQSVIDVNVHGGMRVSHAARPLLAASKGSIVFIASVMSFFGGPKQPAYSTSKGAIRNLTMSLGAAWAPEGIRVNAVAPGWVVTNLSRGARENSDRNAMILSRTPIGRWAEPEEMAEPVLFLCSDGARYMNGSVMTVDGGYCTVG